MAPPTARELALNNTASPMASKADTQTRMTLAGVIASWRRGGAAALGELTMRVVVGIGYFAASPGLASSTLMVGTSVEVFSFSPASRS